MDGFSASCEIGPAMILVSRWGAFLDQPSVSLHRSPSLISLYISLRTPRFLAVFPLRTPPTPPPPHLSTVLSTDTTTAVCVFCDCAPAYVCSTRVAFVFSLHGPSPARAANGFHKHLSGLTSYLLQSEK